jgi:hypothetical protein
VLIEEVDPVGPKPAERCLGHLLHVLGATVQPVSVSPIDAEAELGGDHDLVAPPLQRAAEQLFVGERTVDLGRIEQGNAELDRAVYRCDRLALVAWTVELAHPHAAEPERSHLEPLESEPSSFDHPTRLMRVRYDWLSRRCDR